eukprot:Rhum_TRINITY_DN18799_c0_g1::Rhum_TRINITY_DN18799_c0_g1_i1::g.168142::m.168142
MQLRPPVAEAHHLQAELLLDVVVVRQVRGLAERDDAGGRRHAVDLLDPALRLRLRHVARPPQPHGAVLGHGRDEQRTRLVLVEDDALRGRQRRDGDGDDALRVPLQHGGGAGAEEGVGRGRGVVLLEGDDVEREGVGGDDGDAPRRRDADQPLLVLLLRPVAVLAVPRDGTVLLRVAVEQREVDVLLVGTHGDLARPLEGHDVRHALDVALIVPVLVLRLRRLLHVDVEPSQGAAEAVLLGGSTADDQLVADVLADEDGTGELHGDLAVGAQLRLLDEDGRSLLLDRHRVTTCTPAALPTSTPSPPPQCLNEVQIL